ncbi:MAG: hypothetical protein ACRDLN_10475 [Solirubrobacteraceae bacterium]
MGDSINYGIIGDVSANNLAVGPHARIDVAAADPAVAGQLQALLDAIAALDGGAGARPELEKAGNEVAQALAQPAPDTERALSWLSRITSVAGSAGTIAGAATALQRAVEAIV